MRDPDWQSDDGKIRLWCGDCRDLLGGVTCDVVITDPPYGIRLANHAPGKERADRDWTIAGDGSQEIGQWVVDWAATEKWPCIAFASPMKPWLGKWRQHLVWEKGEHVSGGGDPFLCWKPSWELLQVARNKRLNGGRDGAVLRVLADKGDYDFHPSPKPVALMEYLVEKASNPGDVICDPCFGSGSTAVAAARLGRGFIGIEIDPAHFATAVRRIEAELKRQPLFAEPPAKQVELFNEAS